MFFTTLLVITLRTLLWWENKKLDRQYGSLEEQKARAGAGEKNTSQDGELGVAVENYGPIFRYVL
jgi:MFS transporter, ACS family, DAL5 transporter family protein